MPNVYVVFKPNRIPIAKWKVLGILVQDRKLDLVLNATRRTITYVGMVGKQQEESIFSRRTSKM
jgi:hypothetical protein